MKLVEDLTAVVVGGGDIGLAIAAVLVEHGAQVVVWDLRQEVIENLSEEISGHVVDVTLNDQMAELTASVVDEYGSIDILVNSAGVLSCLDVEDMTTELWQETIDLNLGGVFRTCRAVVGHMIKQRSGSIVNISSESGLRGSAGFSHYSASKFGVIGFSESLAQEVGEHGVRVNCVCPGAVESRMNTETLAGVARRQGRSYATTEHKVIERTALRRLVKPENVADAVLFLSSGLSSCITGIALPVSGGLS